MTYLLDTNIISAHLRRPAGLQHRFIQHGARIAVPTIVLAELYAWAFGRNDPIIVLGSIARALEDLSVIDFDPASAMEFGRLRVELRRQGHAVSPPDLMIASTALAHDLIVVTDNTRHFEVIPGLRLENWLESSSSTNRSDPTMPDDRIATVRPIEEGEATGRVAAVFADIKKTKNIDFIPAFWRVIAINPSQLELVWTTLKSLMHPESVGRTPRLDPTTREVIALAVSATNGCAYCINSHTAALRKLGMDDEALGEVMAIVGLFNMTNSLANGYQVEPDVRPKVD